MDSGIVGNSRRLGPKHGTCMALSVSGCPLFWYTECEGGSKQLKEESYLYHEREREREKDRQTHRYTEKLMFLLNGNVCTSIGILIKIF